MNSRGGTVKREDEEVRLEEEEEVVRTSFCCEAWPPVVGRPRWVRIGRSATHRHSSILVLLSRIKYSYSYSFILILLPSTLA